MSQDLTQRIQYLPPWPKKGVDKEQPPQSDPGGKEQSTCCEADAPAKLAEPQVDWVKWDSWVSTNRTTGAKSDVYIGFRRDGLLAWKEVER